VIPNAARIETMKAVHIGYIFVYIPIAIPPNAICESASPKREWRLKTRNNPIIEEITAMATPAVKARCIKLNSRISRIIVVMDIMIILH
jgi:hypothetical protein